MLRLLSGSGVEIGALNDPVYAPHLEVKYVDRVTEPTLRRHYQELDGLPLAPVDIVDDGQTLATIADDSLDFVIANHVIEHMANAIAALANWRRVLKPAGRLFLAVPDKEHSFDRTRPLTSLEHLVADYEDPSDERDYEAFREFAREVSARTLQVCPLDESDALAERMWKEQYSIHYHVWNRQSFDEFLAFLPNYLGDWSMATIDVAPTMDTEFIYVLEKR